MAWLRDRGYRRPLVDWSRSIRAVDPQNQEQGQRTRVSARHLLRHLHRLPLRRRRDVSRSLVRAEAQKRTYVPGAVQIAVLFKAKQFDVAPDGDGDDGVADIGQFAGRVSAGGA